MAKPRQLRRDYLPRARCYAERVTGQEPPTGLDAFVRWSYDHIDTTTWRRLQASVRVTTWRERKMREARDAPMEALDALLLDLVAVANTLEGRGRGLTKGGIARLLREAVEDYSGATGWSMDEARDRARAKERRQFEAALAAERVDTSRDISERTNG